MSGVKIYDVEEYLGKVVGVKVDEYDEENRPVGKAIVSIYNASAVDSEKTSVQLNGEQMLLACTALMSLTRNFPANEVAFYAKKIVFDEKESLFDVTDFRIVSQKEADEIYARLVKPRLLNTFRS